MADVNAPVAADGHEIDSATRSTYVRLEKPLAEALNRVGAENASGTPDFVLGRFLSDCLAAFDRAVEHRSRWYSRPEAPFDVAGMVFPSVQTVETLRETLKCARAWAPEARLIGNVQACDIACAVEYCLELQQRVAEAVLDEEKDAARFAALEEELLRLQKENRQLRGELESEIEFEAGVSRTGFVYELYGPGTRRRRLTTKDVAWLAAKLPEDVRARLLRTEKAEPSYDLASAGGWYNEFLSELGSAPTYRELSEREQDCVDAAFRATPRQKKLVRYAGPDSDGKGFPDEAYRIVEAWYYSKGVPEIPLENREDLERRVRGALGEWIDLLQHEQDARAAERERLAEHTRLASVVSAVMLRCAHLSACPLGCPADQYPRVHRDDCPLVVNGFGKAMKS